MTEQTLEHADTGRQEGVRAAAYRRCIDGFNRGDVDAAAAFADDNAVIHEVSSLPWGGLFHGADGFRKLVINLGAQFAEGELVLEHLVEFGDNGLFIIARMVGRAKGTMAPIDEYYHEVMFFEGEDPARFTFARICFADDVRILRALGYDSFPDQTVASPA
jgi:ketosteroid isomerase-like protein